MAYLGRGLDKISNVEVLDNITFDGSSSYSITKGSVAFTPNSAQSLLISIDGVVQATNFTVNGSTIDFGVAIPSTSVCNFFLHYGTGVMTVPSDGSVTTAKLGSNAVTSAKMFSGFANGITEADQWRLTANITSDVNPISANLERVDDASFSKIGTGMSVSSGYWTFPSTGLYRIEFIGRGVATTPGDNILIKIHATIDNSSYDAIAESADGNDSVHGVAMYCTALVNVTDISNVKVTFEVSSLASGSYLQGDTDDSTTSFMFTRLGDSQ